MNETNCAIGWYDLETGDSWYFGADTYIKAGSMYKLPLVMAVTDKIAAGKLTRRASPGATRSARPWNGPSSIPTTTPPRPCGTR